MRLKLYQEVALVKDIPEQRLKAGDVAVLVDYAPHPAGGEEGAVLEIFSALGESLFVAVVPVSAIAALRADQVPAVRPVATR
jgi:hypothetical protein